VQRIATVEYGPGEEQIEVLNGEFPPPAVWSTGGVLVLEDAPVAGLTGDAVIVQTVPDVEFEDGTARRFQPVTIDVAEPNDHLPPTVQSGLDAVGGNRINWGCGSVVVDLAARCVCFADDGGTQDRTSVRGTAASS